MADRDSSQLRIADADREQMIEQLREHTVAGRLSADEFEVRLEGVYNAKTVAELSQLGVDLPELPRSPALRRAELAERRTELRLQLLQQTGGALVPFTVCTAVWAASGAGGGFWPAWVLIFPLVALVRNGWQLYGPAPDLDRVEAELRRSRHSRRSRGRGSRHRHRDTDRRPRGDSSGRGSKSGT